MVKIILNEIWVPMDLRAKGYNIGVFILTNCCKTFALYQLLSWTTTRLPIITNNVPQQLIIIIHYNLNNSNNNKPYKPLSSNRYKIRVKPIYLTVAAPVVECGPHPFHVHINVHSRFSNVSTIKFFVHGCLESDRCESFDKNWGQNVKLKKKPTSLI